MIHYDRDVLQLATRSTAPDRGISWSQDHERQH
jgi:hypothetical protein